MSAESGEGAPSHPEREWQVPIPPAPGGARWWHKRRIRVIAAVGLFVVLAGVATSLWAPWRDAGAPRRAPFYLAVSALSRTSMIHYAGFMPDTHNTWDLHVTSTGDELGVMTVRGGRHDVMTVGAATYFKPPKDRLAQYAGDAPTSDLAGVWLTGDGGVTEARPLGLEQPSKVAYELWRDLGAATDFPRIGAAATRVGTTPALRVTLAHGVLYVSARAPYRVLRLTTPSAAASTRPTVTTSQRTPPAADAHGDETNTLGDFGWADFAEVSPAEADRIYAELAAQARTLGSAVDTGVTFTGTQAPGLRCSDLGCTLTERVTTSATTAERHKLGGFVQATMKALVTANGQAAGTCVATERLPVNGSGVISCLDEDAGPVIRRISGDVTCEAIPGYTAHAVDQADIGRAAVERTEAARQAARTGAVARSGPRAGNGATADVVLRTGFQPGAFPSEVGASDRPARLAVEENGPTVVLDYADHDGDGDGVVAVSIPRADFDARFRRYVGSRDGVPDVTVAVPATLFDQLNRYPRTLVEP
jgi:hypothetical protein